MVFHLGKQCVCLLLPVLCQARLGMDFSSRNEMRGTALVDAVPLSELASALGQNNRFRIKRIEMELRPMYTALPKNSRGTLNGAVVRYALHRFFIQQHGWSVRGLEPNGDAWNSSTPTAILKDRVPHHVLALVEQHLKGRGFGLHELAVLAATLDDLVHGEAIERLSKAYAAHEIDIHDITTIETANLIVQTYMMFYILPDERLLSLQSVQIERVLPLIHMVYPGWNDTMLWMNDLWQSLDHNGQMKRNPFLEIDRAEMDFTSTSGIVEEVGAKFGRFQDLECRSLKWMLLDLEDGDTGRVPLSSFYGHTLNGGWQFKERVEYLRDLGALDESNPKRPSVMIPNYLGGQSNCHAASEFYSVCCIDECESLMMRLEVKISGPLGVPQDIAEFVAHTPSDTVDAPRNLSSMLLGRLSDMSAQHGGRVPLHGRLFSQWMHHAYPRECPYPHPIGSGITPMPIPAWKLFRNMTTVSASQEEMEEHVNSSLINSAEDLQTHADLPWSEDEELVAMLDPATAPGAGRNALRLFVCFSMISLLVSGVRQTSKNPLSQLLLHGGRSPVSKVTASQFV